MKFSKEIFLWVIPPLIVDIWWHIYSLPTIYNPWLYFFVITFPTSVGLIVLASLFRDPDRIPDSNHIEGKTILSPADGELCGLEEEDGNIAIYIEMHYYNVHVARAHLSGRVTKISRGKGKHYLVYFIKKNLHPDTVAIRKNARVIIDLEDAQGKKFKFFLICGAFFRRAKPYVKVGDEIYEGQRVGVIAFGSTVKITLPGKNYRMIAKFGDKLKGGKSILCERSNEPINMEK
jgi:phosphatidylserine decarboxylase precursor-related protein